MLRVWCVNVGNTVVELSQLAAVPTVGGTYQVTCNSLQLVDVAAAALRANLKVGICILVSAVETTVTVVVYRAIAHVVLIHHVNNACNYCRVVGCITINLYIEDVAATGQIVVRCLYLCLFHGGALVIYWHVVTVGIVIAVGNARDNAKLLAVFLGELTAQSLGWCSEDRVVVMILLAELVCTVAHVGHNLQS